jgi:signal transduction histidine kinase/response regulator of citrate/malate metabolism
VSEGRAPSVTIADNNAFYRQLIGDFYRDLGFEVCVAGDGLEALEQLRLKKPDLVVLDLIMPRIDGAQACRMLKKSEEFAQVPVIILSGILADEIEDVDSIGADAYIAKMRFEEVQAALKLATREVMCRRSREVPLVYGFEKMYRREVVLELLHEARRRQTVFESLSEGTVELSEGRRVLMTNQAFRDMVGMPEAGLLSLKLEELFPENKAVLQSLFDRLEKEPGVASATCRCAGREFGLKLHSFTHRQAPSPAATERHIMSTRSPSEAVSQTVQVNDTINGGYTLLVEDITDRVRAEREREHLRARLNQNEKMSAVGLFVSGAAHELNNPLTTVLGYAELLIAGGEENANRRELMKIISGARRCKAILMDLMSFTRRTRPEMVVVDLALLLPEVALAYQGRLQEIGAELELAIDPDQPTIMADPAQLRQTFGLIIDNAVKALAEAASMERKLTISSSAVDGTITIRFSDTGPGIPERALGRLFDPFFTTREVGQGQGLGLSVAYGIVLAHRGRVTATNKPSGGAEVTIQLPIQPPERTGPVERPAGAVAPRRSRILVVDDEAVVAELLSDILEAQEHHIDVAYNGREGLEKIRSCDYDAIILDLRMPDINGQQMYELMAREMPEKLDKLMFITADTVTADVERFLEEVKKPCLTKPFSVQDLLETVRRILP